MKISLLLLAALCIAFSPTRADERPNFVFIYTDDQRYDAIGLVQDEQGARARFPWLRTPNLDRLALDGVRFRNAFVTISLCAPSRASFLTGRYSHENGVKDNRTALPLDSVTYASLLRAAGYRTAYMGKWHMGGQRERPGFDESASFVGQGKYFDCPLLVNGQETPTTGWVDDVTTEYALGFIRQHKDKPFVLALGFKTAHGPFEPAPRAKGRYEGETARPVPNLSTPAIYLQQAAEKAAAPGKKGKRGPGPGVGGPTQGQMEGIASIDDNVGKVLDELEKQGLRGRTVVVFTADNGYYLGEHRLGDKRTAYEESMRIPMIVSWPGHFTPAVREQMVLNIDIAPTFLQLAGLTPPAAMRGRDLGALLRGENPEWRHAFFYEYFQERGFGAPTVLAVRTETAKLVKYPGHDEWTEMFDLQADPYEIKNLIREPVHAELLASLGAEFDRQAKAVDFRMPASDGPAAKARSGACVLDFDFTGGARGKAVADASGSKNHGQPSGLTFAAGREGKTAAHFDGKGKIEVGKSPSLDPSGGAWSVEATVRSEGANGAIVARGGKTQGYALYLQDGKPAFTVTVGNTATTVIAERVVTGQWVRLGGNIASDSKVVLSIDGEAVGSRKLGGFITQDPRDTMQIGNDTGSQVLDYVGGAAFYGLVERVRIFAGERQASE